MDATVDSNELELLKKALMWHSVKGFTEIQHEYIHVLPLIHPSEKVMGGD